MIEKNEDIASSVTVYLSEFCSIDLSKIKNDSELVKDLHIEGDDGIELIDSFSKRFNVDMTSFSASEYFVQESSFNPIFSIWKLVFRKNDLLKPLYVKDLIESAALKRWAG
ncbi:DUF1493 family protein [Marinomonas transparens]|uniref:DUF1493 family protein n=1 Tax=Marinomonas transparens TaxID=2795388 RepID=A0A934JS31_9GAMM|nr:DUF1493 family protein [Marinomonas transparens]MBJ7539668.1 DUF1493 family protein [Marinomonas transparens]